MRFDALVSAEFELVKIWEGNEQNMQSLLSIYKPVVPCVVLAVFWTVTTAHCRHIEKGVLQSQLDSIVFAVWTWVVTVPSSSVNLTPQTVAVATAA